MKCAKAQELFSSYLEKTIQPPLGVAFEQHLAECAQCKAAYDRFHATTVVLDELPMVEPPPDMRAAVMARVEAARREAPGRVNWLHMDWQRAFTLRVPAKAVAMGIAVVLASVGLMQLPAVHTYTAGLIGGQRATQDFPDPSGIGGRPLPSGFKTDSEAKYADVAAGLSIGVRVVSSSASSAVYVVRLGARGDAEVPVQVSVLPVGSLVSDASDMPYAGMAAKNREAQKTIEVTQSGDGRAVKIAVVSWKSGGQSFTEYVYMPSVFGKVTQDANASVSGVGMSELLSKLSADYGTVIIADGQCAARTATVSVNAASADAALSAASRQAGLELRPLAPSIYSVK